MNLHNDWMTDEQYFEGDSIFQEDIEINGNAFDDNDNILNISSNNILIPNYASMNKCEYTIGIGINKCVGKIDIEILPFDATVNYDKFSINEIKFTSNSKLDEIKQSAKAHLCRQIEKIRFYNNIGNKLNINYGNVVVDTSNIQLENGTYTVPYVIYFYNANIYRENIYNSVSGTFNVVIESPTVIDFNSLKNQSSNTETSDTVPSLTASTLMFSMTASSYDININNKPSSATYSWKSSNTKVAKVDSKGVVQGVSDGEAIITCSITTPDGKKQDLKSTIKVGQDDNFPVLSDNDLIIDVNDTYSLKVENKESGSTVRFTSSNKSVAKVSTSGKITGVSVGKTVITTTITKGTDVVVLQCNVEVE
jgi:uncharacterized protein YjdB